MTVITTTEELKKLVDSLLSETFVTIDTEFLRDRTYYPQVCLIQLGGTHGAWAVDPLAKGISLEPLKKLLKAKDVVKVLHSGVQDIEIFFNVLDTIPKPVFDTQIAGQVLGYGEAISYAALVKDICGKKLDKSSRFTDWGQRPLSERQIDYALCDVTYLRDVYLHMLKKLDAAGRHSWVEEDVAELLDKKNYVNDPKEAWLKIPTRHGSSDFIGIVKQLAKWREETAQRLDIPRGRIVRDDGITEIAAVQPKTEGELRQLRRVHIKSIEKYGKDFIEAVKKGNRWPAKLTARAPRRAKLNDPLFSLLRVLLKTQAEKHGAAQSLIISIDSLKELSSMDYKEAKKSALPVVHGWRYDIFGKYALMLMQGRLGMTVDGEQIILLEKGVSDDWD